MEETDEARYEIYNYGYSKTMFKNGTRVIQLISGQF